MEIKVGGKSYSVAREVYDALWRLQVAYRQMRAEKEQALALRDEARANVRLLVDQVQRLEKRVAENESLLNSLLGLEEK